MLHAPQPIYEFLYYYLRDTFSFETIRKEDRAFNALESAQFLCRCARGPVYFTRQNVDYTLLPHGYLDWGQIGDVELDRAPDCYKYELVYRFVIHTAQGQGNTEETVFRSVEDDGASLGIGDIVTTIMQRVWGDLHVSQLRHKLVEGRLGTLLPHLQSEHEGESRGLLPTSDTDWWVSHWTFNVDGETADSVDEWRDILAGVQRDPLLRETVINFKFNVFERQTLGI